jgi:hypothetical protein
MLGAGWVAFGTWLLFLKQWNYGIGSVTDIISGAICFAFAAHLMNFGRDMIKYYRIK